MWIKIILKQRTGLVSSLLICSQKLNKIFFISSAFWPVGRSRQTSSMPDHLKCFWTKEKTVFHLLFHHICVYLVIQSPSQIFQASVIEEVIRIRFQPKSQLLNTRRTNVCQSVAVAVHKDATEDGVHHE